MSELVRVVTRHPVKHDDVTYPRGVGIELPPDVVRALGEAVAVQQNVPLYQPPPPEPPVTHEPLPPTQPHVVRAVDSSGGP